MRTSVQFGRTQAVWADDSVRFQGRDDDGKRWQAVLPFKQGLGYTAVWQADFDHNSRPDLLIASYDPRNGRCTDGVTLYFLLFNDHGQPVPWVIQTHAPNSRQFFPDIFADLNHNGRAELVVTDCAYSYSEPRPRSGEDRSITGIYEAKDATWSLIKPANLASYTALINDQLLPANSSDWLDQGNRLDPRGSPAIRLTAVFAASDSCRGVWLPIVDGRVQEGPRDNCDELGHDRMQLSNGTVCYDWPTVMVDGEDGREIVAESAHPEPLLQKIIGQRRTVVLAGQKDPNRCSPVLLWALRAR
jgi:hypothetical protein